MNSTIHDYGFNHQWVVRHEPIFRLLDKKEYIDNFFTNGELLLSCFTQFKNYSNEIKGDKKEGQAMLFAKTTEGKTIVIYFNSASNAFILSTTKKVNEQIIKDFKSVGAIKINNPTSFAMQVSNRIPFFAYGTEGNCVYQKERIIHRELTEEQTKKYSKENMQIVENEFNLIAEVSNNDETFIKLNKYSYQNEFRLVWFSNIIQKNHLIIHCPEAIQFCERVDF